MLISPKWQTMWMESQHCSKSVMNVPLPSQQAEKVLEDLRTNCCSPNKTVQLEALKCWGVWIKNQNSNDWKLNTVCFTAVRPLITKKMQPLNKDVDICKLKLSLMWALLVKVQNIMQLEGPQYILEVFLQSCLSWLSAADGDGHEDEVSVLILQLLLSILKRNETLNDFDKEVFTPLSTDILQLKKVFHFLADKFLNIFIYWKKVSDKKIFLKLWKNFLEHCELSCENIPIPLWNKVFKLADHICSEKTETVKERLAFLHSSAITLKSALSSSKFIDYGNLLTTPCEVLFKKLVELCTIECTEICDSEMFLHSKEISQVLSDRSVAIGGFDLCISVVNVLEEFWLKDLFWGVWCGLVCCYKVHLMNVDKNKMSKPEIKFFRKLRGVAVNFELDKDVLQKDCLKEVEKHIKVLNIRCLCPSLFKAKEVDEIGKDISSVEPMEPEDPQTLCCFPNGFSKGNQMALTPFYGKFKSVSSFKEPRIFLKKIEILKHDLIKCILPNFDLSSRDLLVDCLFSLQFLKAVQPVDVSLHLKVSLERKKEELNRILSCLETNKPNSLVPYKPQKSTEINLVKKKDYEGETEDHDESGSEEIEIISTPKTRSKKRAEEEKRKVELENQRRKKRKSFEVIVQEIVRKNKERKTEKNSKRKSPVVATGKKNKKKAEKMGNHSVRGNDSTKKKTSEGSDRKLRNSKEEKVKEKNSKTKVEKSFKPDGKLENYFKVITKKSGIEKRKEEKKSAKGKEGGEREKGKVKESSCCKAEKEEEERKGEIGWRQTSLKTMMNRRNKSEKVRPETRIRSKTVDDPNEKPKQKKETKVADSPLSKLSPFKEVFHDHEYAKIEPQELETFQRVFLAKQKKATGQKIKKTKSENEKLKKRKLMKQRKPEVEENSLEFPDGKNLISPTNNSEENPKVASGEKSKSTEVQTLEGVIELTDPVGESKVRIKHETTEEKLEVKIEVAYFEPEPHSIKLKNKDEVDVEERKSKKVDAEFPEETADDLSTLKEITEKDSESVENRSKGSRKRVRITDSLRRCKRLKLEEENLEEEKLPLEITEKENLDEQTTTPTKKVVVSCSTPKSEGSPKATNGMISSRALRMIALVPESTKSSQMQWETSPRAEVFKFKKAPNVDKNSRASKMLALLSENVTEVEEEENDVEEDKGDKGLMTTPNMKTPVSSLKSPKSIKKRRSIRFDDAKNETVLYKTDTPPSQILEEKEKCRRIKATEY